MVQPEGPQMTIKYETGKMIYMPDNYGKNSATHNIQYLLLFHGKNGYANAPQYYVVRKVPVLLILNSALKFKV